MTVILVVLCAMILVHLNVDEIVCRFSIKNPYRFSWLNLLLSRESLNKAKRAWDSNLKSYENFCKGEGFYGEIVYHLEVFFLILIIILSAALLGAGIVYSNVYAIIAGACVILACICQFLYKENYLSDPAYVIWLIASVAFIADVIIAIFVYSGLMSWVWSWDINIAMKVSIIVFSVCLILFLVKFIPMDDDNAGYFIGNFAIRCAGVAILAFFIGWGFEWNWKLIGMILLAIVILAIIIAVFIVVPEIGAMLVISGLFIFFMIKTSNAHHSDDVIQSKVTSVSLLENDSLKVITEDSLEFVFPKSYAPISPGDEIYHKEEQVTVERQKENDDMFGLGMMMYTLGLTHYILSK